MKTKAAWFGLCALLAACAAQAQAAVQMKPGLWERETRQLKWEVDGKDRLATMSADERENLVKPKVERLCVSATMARGNLHWLILRDTEGKPILLDGCTQPKVNRNGDRITFEITCKGAKAVDSVDLKSGKRRGETYEFTEVHRSETVLAPDQVTTDAKKESVETKVQDGRMVTIDETEKPELRMHESQTKMKFLGNDCGNLWPPQGKPPIKPMQPLQNRAKKSQR